MKVLVVFHSVTGNTEKIARAIFEEVSSSNEADLKRFKEISVEQTADYNLVFVGAPCHDSDLSVPAKRWLDAIPHSSSFKLAGFFTHATYMREEGNPRFIEIYDKWAGRCHVTFETISQEKSIDFLGYFNCMGVPSDGIEKFINKEIITDPEEWAEYLPVVRKHPDTKDIEAAKAFAHDMISKI